MTAQTKTQSGIQSEPDEKGLKEVVQAVLDYARTKGADQAEAAASHNLGLSATARLGDVESLESDLCL